MTLKVHVCNRFSICMCIYKHSHTFATPSPREYTNTFTRTYTQKYIQLVAVCLSCDYECEEYEGHFHNRRSRNMRDSLENGKRKATGLNWKTSKENIVPLSTQYYAFSLVYFFILSSVSACCAAISVLVSASLFQCAIRFFLFVNIWRVISIVFCPPALLLHIQGRITK